MKKKLVFICTVCLLVLTMGLLVGCGGDKPSDKDPIIGTWVGQSDEDGVSRFFYATVKADLNDSEGFIIEANVVFKEKESAALTKGKIYLNNQKQYIFDGDFSPLPHETDKVKFRYRLNMDGKNKFTAVELHIVNNASQDYPTGRTVAFERTTLTLAQYEEQLRAEKQ